MIANDDATDIITTTSEHDINNISNNDNTFMRTDNDKPETKNRAALNQKMPLIEPSSPNNLSDNITSFNDKNNYHFNNNTSRLSDVSTPMPITSPFKENDNLKFKQESICQLNRNILDRNVKRTAEEFSSDSELLHTGKKRKSSPSPSLPKDCVFNRKNIKNSIRSKSVMSIRKCITPTSTTIFNSVPFSSPFKALKHVIKPLMSQFTPRSINNRNEENFKSINKFENDFINVPLPDLGGNIIFSTDDFFGTASNLLKSSLPKEPDNTLTDFGTLVDGWETRRRRIPGHDWCIIELGSYAKLKEIEINTKHFIGNYAPYCSIEGAYIPDLKEQIYLRLKEKNEMPYKQGDIGIGASIEAVDAINELLKQQGEEDKSQWRDIIEMTSLNPGDTNPIVKLSCSTNLDIVTHIRLNIFSDGGFARLKAFGIGQSPLDSINKEVLLSSLSSGALVLYCSNMFFSNPQNILKYSSPQNMYDGWETKRKPNRSPYVEIDKKTGFIINNNENDFVIIKLAHRGTICKIEINTKYFLGNYPESFSIEGADISLYESEDIDFLTLNNKLPKTKLSPGTNHIFNDIKKKK